MTLEVLLALAGIILLVYGLLGNKIADFAPLVRSLQGKPSPKTSPPPPPDLPVLLRGFIVVLGIMFIAAAIVTAKMSFAPDLAPTPCPAQPTASSGVCAVNTPCPTPVPTQPPTATPAPSAIPLPTAVPEWKTNIADGDPVAQTTTLIAEYSGELPGDLWVFVMSPNGRYYPISNDAGRGASLPKVGRRWEGRLNIGSATADAGLRFDIIFAVARTPLDSQFISAKLVGWNKQGQFPGFEALPEQVTEVHRIKQVVRQAETWGLAPNLANTTLDGEITITNLENNAQVTETLTLQGTYRNTPEDIWVLVYPSHGRWYPQSASACAGIHTQKKDGHWQVPMQFGADIDKPFDIAVVAANAEASQFLGTYQQMWCSAGFYTGFLTIELPPGIMEKARVRVYRK